MKRLCGLAAVAAIAIVAVFAGTAGAAAPNLNPAQNLCAAQGGVFNVSGLGTEVPSYLCVNSSGSFRGGQLQAAAVVCQFAEGGTFQGSGDDYGCDLPPGFTG